MLGFTPFGTVTAVEIATIVSAILATPVAVRVLWRENFSIPSVAFAVGMGLLVIESILACAGFKTSIEARQITLEQWRLVVVTLIPGVWLLFALTYSRGNYHVFLRRWRVVLAAFLVLPCAVAIVFNSRLIFVAGDFTLHLGPAGRALHVFLLVGVTAVLMNLERTFRASVGVMRWQLKFMILGLAALFLTRVYTSSQFLLYSVVDSSLDVFNAVALSVASLFASVSLHRTKNFNLDLQPSQTLVYQSVAVLLIGAYLVAVGFLARFAAVVGQSFAFPLQALLLFLGLLGLAMLMLSDRVRLQTKRFISRHLRRPLHDFRQVWNRFSEQTVGHVDETGLCRAIVKWIAETFDVLSVTAWLVSPGEGRVVFAASTALTEAAAERLLPKDGHIAEALEKLRQYAYPIAIDDSNEAWLLTLKKLHPAQFLAGGSRVCVPIITGSNLLGVLMVGDRVGNISLSIEDLDLLKSIGDQVARDLIRIRLSHRIAETKEMQAFQTMATFFVHDLKNTASTLSLLVQNLRDHFDRPDFRDDAVRALSKSVARINDLIDRLTSLRQEFRLNPVAAHLDEIVASALKDFDGLADTVLVKSLRPTPRAMLDADQMQRVVVNLVLNAKEAVKGAGEIHVETESQDRYAVLTVRDTGCGMSADFIKRQLFRPFQTTKVKGIGIGMFHTKMIVEAHEGRIQVESMEGQGTTFRVVLPLAGGEN
jgi:putative PEP-CTERM system histidine kinase